MESAEKRTVALAITYMLLTLISLVLIIVGISMMRNDTQDTPVQDAVFVGAQHSFPERCLP